MVAPEAITTRSTRDVEGAASRKAGCVQPTVLTRIWQPDLAPCRAGRLSLGEGIRLDTGLQLLNGLGG